METKTILVVDVDPTTRKALATIFRKKGFSVLAVASGREAIEASKKGFINIGIIDIKLPDMDGFNLIRKLKEVHTDTACIIVTGYSSVENSIKALDEGASGYFLKPIVFEEIFNRVDEILEKQQLERKLREKEARYQEAQRIAQLGHWALDLVNNELEWSEEVYRIFEFKPDEFAPTYENFLKAVHIEDREFVNRAYTESLETKTPYDIVHRLQMQDGRIKYVNERCETVFDEEGNPQRSIGTVHDITEQRKALAHLNRLATVIEQTGEAIVITDIRGKIQYVNPAFEKITGYSKQEAIDKNPNILFSGKHDNAFYRGLWGTILSGEIWHGNLINKKKDGTLYEEEVTISPVCDPTGQITNFVAIKRDVTWEKALEEQFFLAQKMEAVGTLAGGVAHDFNNILMAIGGFAELSLETIEPSNPLYSNLKMIYESSIRATNLTRQLLLYSRKQPMKLNIFNVNDVIIDILKMLHRVIGEDISISTELDTAAHNIKADKGNIEQVIMNLTVNARDAMPDGGNLTIQTGNTVLDEFFCKPLPHVKPGTYVFIKVSDNGPGIKDIDIPHIFEPFFTTKPAGKGTGLGLSVVYGIAEQHGGHVDVESEPGVGATFTIFLPAYTGAIENEKQLRDSLEKYQGNGERILLVEDEEQVQVLIATILENYGYQVMPAADGEEAMDIFKRENGNFEIIYSDVILPGMSGLKLVEELLLLKPELKIIMCSGYTDEKSQWEIIHEKNYQFLHKPAFAVDILEVVQKVLREET